MPALTLMQARTIIDAALAEARRQSFKPMAVAVLDERGVYKAFAAEDGTSLRRAEIAHGKAYGALSLGIGSRAIAKRADDQPSFVAAVTHAAGGALVPVPGGVLIRGERGGLLGAVGVSGDASDNDERVCLAGIEAAGLVGDAG